MKSKLNLEVQEFLDEWEKENDCVMSDTYTFIYVRESTKKQADDGYNLCTQLRKIKDYLQLYDLTDQVRFYIDAGKSAKNINRPALKRMIDDIKNNEDSKKVRNVIIYKLDRLVRRHTSWVEIQKILFDKDVVLHSFANKLDTSTALGRFMINTMISSYELEQDTIGERTDDGLEEGANQGYYIKGKVPFGFEKILVNKHYKLRVVEEQKEMFKKMLGWLRAGYTPYSVMMMVNDDSYMKSIKKTFCENQIVNILKAKINIGIMELKGKEYQMDFGNIYTVEERDEVLSLLSERSKQSKYHYLFDHKVKNASGSFSKLKSTVKPNGVYLYYYDNETKARMNETAIYEAVVDYIKNTNLLYKRVRNQSHKADMVSLNKKYKELEVLYSNLDITTEMYNNAILQIKKEEKKIQKCYKDYVLNVESYLNDMNFDEKSKLIWKNINYIEIDFNSKDIVKIC